MGLCFNPSVGILWGLAQTPVEKVISLVILFQSLGRDSVGFSEAKARQLAQALKEFQSLGRDSVGFSLEVYDAGVQSKLEVSIPRSGFCGV